MTRSVAIIGIDGAGKSSLARQLAKRCPGAVTVKSRRRTLGNLVYDALSIDRGAEHDGRLPTETAAGFVTALFLDFAADQLQLAADQPDLDLVIWDRHARCISAHGLTQGLPPRWLRQLETMAEPPAASIWIDTPPEIAHPRLLARPLEHPETLGYLERARAAYANLCDGDPTVTRLPGDLPQEELVARSWHILALGETR
jgi:dTMP kinase